MRRQWGMLAGLVAPALMLATSLFPWVPCHNQDPPPAPQCLYDRHWAYTVVPMCCMSAAGFLALPAMQVLVMHDFKDMSGLAGGVSKLVMTVTSTLPGSKRFSSLMGL